MQTTVHRTDKTVSVTLPLVVGAGVSALLGAWPVALAAALCAACTSLMLYDLRRQDGAPFSAYVSASTVLAAAAAALIAAAVQVLPLDADELAVGAALAVPIYWLLLVHGLRRARP